MSPLGRDGEQKNTPREAVTPRLLTDWGQIKRTGCPSPRGEGRVFNVKAFSFLSTPL